MCVQPGLRLETMILRKDDIAKITERILGYSIQMWSCYVCGGDEESVNDFLTAPPQKQRRRRNIMSKKSNRINIPEAREAMDKFKMEAASEVGVNLKQGYNGDLSSREAGSVGGQMVKKMTTIRTSTFTRVDRTTVGHSSEYTYHAHLVV